MSIINFMGNTPIVKLKSKLKNSAQIYVKMEEFNPGGSIKARVGIQMIEDAEKNNIIQKGDTLIEPTGGNTGIGLAIAAAIKGYNLILTMPDNFSHEKIKTLEKFGAKIYLANHKLGNDCHIKLAENLLKKFPNCKCLDQFKNLSNPKAHYYGTGKEILNQMQNDIDYFVSSIGSGGTIMGIGRRLKETLPKIKIIGVQPNGCDLKKGIYIPHKIESIAVGKVGTFMDFDLLDDMINVTFQEIEQEREYLAKSQGLFVGLSSGANILAARKLSEKLDKEKVIVTIAPDSGRNYL